MAGDCVRVLGLVEAGVDSPDEMGVSRAVEAPPFTSALEDEGCWPMSGRSVIPGVAYLGKISRNFLLFRLNACDLAANSRFWASVVLTAPAVILSCELGQHSSTHSSLSMKLSRPVRIVATDQAAFHVLG
jgi:hypothetical protein